ncbi:hypothetical protein HC251_07305 [Iamia sp. SCSIO 61187]|uniref:hypothetical protein n=1 Tax=Iamia sp. SCSIO 61187 TaxID=2722752 RepID=UPI001C6343C3|nr:hypothetical protein [Iamia sp. SCSIO 61187]QYG92264.1 hypothetical protein HC251_07305 [Iamia sp. SCSIO 61187]
MPVTKRIRLLFPGGPPPDAPQAMWISDDATADDVAERVPGAVGFIDLDRWEADVQEGTLTRDEVAAALEAVRESRAGG